MGSSEFIEGVTGTYDALFDSDQSARIAQNRRLGVAPMNGVQKWDFRVRSFDGTVKVSSEIAAPVERVFQIFTDIEHGAERVSGIKKIERLTPGRFSLGTRWQETREILGRLDDAEMEVTAFELNRAYTITHHKAGVRMDAEFTFEPIAGGTRAGGTKVSIEFGLGHQGLPPGLLSPLEWAIAGKVRDVLTHDLTDLKQSIEKVVR